MQVITGRGQEDRRMTDRADGHAGQTEAEWSEAEAEHWVAQERRYEAMLGPFGLRAEAD